MWEGIQSLLTEVLLLVLLVLLTVISNRIKQWLEALGWGKEVETETQLVEQGNKIIVRVLALCKKAVLEAEADGARELRTQLKKIENEKNSKDYERVALKKALKAYGSQAVEQVLAELTDEGVEILESTVGDARKFVTGAVESILEEIKRKYPTINAIVEIEQPAQTATGPFAMPLLEPTEEYGENSDDECAHCEHEELCKATAIFESDGDIREELGLRDDVEVEEVGGTKQAPANNESKEENS